MTYVAHTSEDLRNYLTWAIVGESAGMFWVGDAPRLSTLDDAESYVQIGPNVSVGIATATLAPFTITGDVTLRARVRVFGGDFGAATLFLSNVNDDGDFAFEDHEIPTGSWQTIESTFTLADVGDLVTSAAAGELVAGIFPGYVLDETHYWVTFLGVEGASLIPLRWRQRDDGLSGGPKQWRGVSSQQVGRQHRGYL